MGKARMQERDLHIENSWPGKLFRRRQFYIGHYRARRRWSTLRRLEQVLKNILRTIGLPV
jgi:hypothetical protein